LRIVRRVPIGRARVAARDAAAAPVFAAIAKLLSTLGAAPVKSTPVINMLKYLEDPEHLFDPGLDAEGWMRKSGVDPATGRDLFTQEVGLGPGRFLREARLLTAAHLVADTEVSGLLIGELVGFEQQVTFVRAFEAWLGCSPRVFRETRGPKFRFKTRSGEEILSRQFLDRLRSGRATEDEASEFFDRLFYRLREYMAQPGAAVEAEFEKRLAEELWERRLAPRPTRCDLELCRRLFNTGALEELLARKGFKPDPEA
jgi:AraC-like DNA-binding protein